MDGRSGSVVFSRRTFPLHDTDLALSNLVLTLVLLNTGTFFPLRLRIFTLKQEPPINFQQEAIGRRANQIRSLLI